MSRAARSAVLFAVALAGCTRSGEVLWPADGGGPVVLNLTDVRLSAGFGHACAVAPGARPPTPSSVPAN